MKFIVYSLVIIFEDEIWPHIQYQTYLQAVLGLGDGTYRSFLKEQQVQRQKNEESWQLNDSARLKFKASGSLVHLL